RSWRAWKRVSTPWPTRRSARPRASPGPPGWFHSGCSCASREDLSTTSALRISVTNSSAVDGIFGIGDSPGRPRTTNAPRAGGGAGNGGRQGLPWELSAQIYYLPPAEQTDARQTAG